jgi:biopolymer transport protein ExbD/predicted Ser/Thr protein kinase
MEKQCPQCGHRFDPEIVPGLKDGCPRCMANYLKSEGRGLSSFDTTGNVEDETAPLQVGAKLRGYEVLEYLGRGGMGFVYKAKQAGLDRVVALKVLAPRLAGSLEFAARFTREAKALATLSHPNIVQIFDYGHENGLYFLVMEYVDGTSLRRILSTQRLNPETALRYVPQICDALEFAHTAGVVHRDIKPENILIDKRGGLKIADFGLAKIAAGAPGKPGAAAEPKGHATVSGQVMGTPHYMAPEQVENTAAVDHRADIYSLGVVFYEMLTGELPLGRFPSPSQKVQVDVRFDEVVLKALEKEPEKRYQRASLVKEDVSRLSTALGNEVKAEGSPARAWRMPVARIALGLVSGLVAIPVFMIVDHMGIGEKNENLAMVGGLVLGWSIAEGLVRRSLTSFAVCLAFAFPAAIGGWLLLGPLDPVTNLQAVAAGFGTAIGLALSSYQQSCNGRAAWLVLVACLFSLPFIGILLYLLKGHTADFVTVGGGVFLHGATALALSLKAGTEPHRTRPRLAMLAWTFLGLWLIPLVGWGTVYLVGVLPKQRALEKQIVEEFAHMKQKRAQEAERISWGQPVNGLQAGLAVKQTRFEAGQAIRITFSLKNTGSAPVNLGEVWSPWSFRFEDAGGSKAPVYFDAPWPLQRSPGVLAAGAHWEDEGAVENQLADGNVHASKLPVGKYRITGVFRSQTEALRLTVTTGPVEIEIVEPGKASAEKPETPAVKDVASHDELGGLFGNRVVESKKRYAAFVVHIDRAGACAIAGAVFAGEALDERIAGAAKKAGFDGTGTVSKLKVVIRAEAQTPYSAIQHTMMACAQARVVDVSLAVGDNEPIPTPLPKDPGLRPDGTNPELPPEVRIRLFREKPDGPVLCLLPGNVDLPALPAEEALKAVADNKTAWKGAAIVIAPDADMPFEAVAKVLDACVKASLTRIVFSTPAPAPAK